MMNQLKAFVRAAIFAGLFSSMMGPSTAQAGAVITFTHEGIGSGRLNNEIFFNDTHFIITAFGDLEDREQDGDVYSIDHLPGVTIEIDGVGTFAILSPTRTFVNQSDERVGFSRTGPDRTDLFNGPTHPEFFEWDMTTSIGPFADNSGRLFHWNEDPFIETTGGRLVFDDEEDVFVRFTAIVEVPGPPPLAALPLAALLCPRRRRRSA